MIVKGGVEAQAVGGGRTEADREARRALEVPNDVLNVAALATAGAGRPHENRVPSPALNICICIDPQGVYPPRG